MFVTCLSIHLRFLNVLLPWTIASGVLRLAAIIDSVANVCEDRNVTLGLCCRPSKLAAKRRLRIEYIYAGQV